MRCVIHALIAQSEATEENLPGITGIGRACTIHGRDLCRALCARDFRRRITSREVLMQRLLSLGYVLEYSRLSSLPTGPEKARAFEALGIEHRLLPLRVHRRAAGSTRHDFALKLPVAPDADRAVFVHVYPGLETATALRSQGAAHRDLWKVLRKRGRRIDVVALARAQEELSEHGADEKQPGGHAETAICKTRQGSMHAQQGAKGTGS